METDPFVDASERVKAVAIPGIPPAWDRGGAATSTKTAILI